MNLNTKPLKIKFMPYKSEAQRKYFHAHEEELKKQGVNIKEWDKASKGKKLPKKVTKGMAGGMASALKK